VVIDGKVYNFDFHSVSEQPVYSLLIDGRSFEAYVSTGDDLWQVMLNGQLFTAKVEDERERRLRMNNSNSITGGAELQIKAPMPGLVVTVAVEEGQQVKKGDLLIILESMKMQNELIAPRDGVISRIRVKAGDNVSQRQTLVSVL
jgi:biotin carboxyl carrier protein